MEFGPEPGFVAPTAPALNEGVFCVAAKAAEAPAPPMAESSSIDFENVYKTVAVRPLCNLRRNWICPASRVEFPFELRYSNPVGHEGHGLAAPSGKVFGRNSCTPRVPLMPRYVAVNCSEPGRSRCTARFQFWA